MLFSIAEHRVRITSVDNTDVISLLPSFKSFTIEDDGNRALLSIVIDDTTKAVEQSRCRLIRDVDTGNGHTKVFRVEDTIASPDGTVSVKPDGYQFIIGDVFGNFCALLIANEDFTVCRCALAGTMIMRNYGLNSSIMLSYAFATSTLDTVLIHASLVRKEGKGYAFTAKSGTGKSTQVSNWLRFIPGCDLMNDDNPVIRIIDGTVYIFGSPWSGKTPCYRNIKAPLAGIAQIKRDTRNHLEPLRTVEAYVTLLPSCSTMKWDERVFRASNITVGKMLATVPVYNLHCLPDRESAEVASQGMCL